MSDNKDTSTLWEFLRGYMEGHKETHEAISKDQWLNLTAFDRLNRKVEKLESELLDTHNLTLVLEKKIEELQNHLDPSEKR